MQGDWHNLIKKTIEIAQKETGIQLSEKNSAMIESRLIKRIHFLGLQTPNEYLDYLEKNFESEKNYIISSLTTHHTAFFREFFHFEDIENKYLQKIVEQKLKTPGDNTIRIWSAACSKGQECFSLSMFFYKLKNEKKLHNLDYKILGTDVDNESINFAKNGVYFYKDLMQSPLQYVQGNWLKGRNEIRNFVKPKQHIKAPLSFEVGNLLSLDSKFKSEKFDIIFCRNVLIYFNHDQIKIIIQSLLERLSPHGFLVLGISESILGLNLPIKLLSNNVYCHEKSVIASAIENGSSLKSNKAILPKILRIMCVDDSPTILAILQKILTKEEGFEVVATAKSAQDAREKLKTLSVDLMTLDIYMPGETGLEYLKRDFDKEKHPPVIILSSIDRDGTNTAKEALTLGASDYIEKPNLKSMDVSTEEIRFKIKTIIKQHKSLSENKLASNSKIKVLIVDDSPTIHLQIRKMLSGSTDIEVIGGIEDPRSLEAFIIKNRPDVITLDINMPYMNGVEVVKKIISKYLIPTIVVSSLGLNEGSSVMEALEYGAIDYFQKPSLNHMEEEAHVLLEKIKSAKNAKIRIHNQFVCDNGFQKININKNYLIAIGSSTGGTEAIKCILERLPENIPPIVIVQHIPPIFSQAFAERLNKIMPFEVVEAKNHQIIKENCVYIAPGDKQMSIVKENQALVIKITDEGKRNNHRPSVDVLFDSIEKLNLSKIIGIILTGMGNDGAAGLKKLKDAGAKTIAQNEESCVVFGMPREAIKLNAAHFIEPIEHISNKIIEISKVS